MSTSSSAGRGSVRQRHNTSCYDKVDTPGPVGEKKRLKLGRDGKHKCRGPWEYHLWLPVDPVTHTRPQVTKGGFRGEKEALAALDDARQEYAVTGGRSRGLTLGDWLDRWLEIQTLAGLSPTTLARYESVCRVHLKPLLGHALLTEVEPDAIVRVLSVMRSAGYRPADLVGKKWDNSSGLSSASVNRAYDVLRAALETARRQRKIAYNPALAVDPPRETNAPMRAWTPEQAAQFLDHPRVAGDRLYAAWHVVLTCGVRRAELAGVYWHHLDLDSAWWDLTESRVQVGSSVTRKSPKSAAGTRRIFLDQGTVAALKRHRQAQREQRLQAGARWVLTPHESPLTGRECDCGGPVFRSPRLLPERERHRLADGKDPKLQGGAVVPGYLSKRWEALVAATGLPRVSLHGGRHTSVTAATQYAAVTEQASIERYGHSSVQVNRRYQHVNAELHRQAAEAVAAEIERYRRSQGRSGDLAAGKEK